MNMNSMKILGVAIAIMSAFIAGVLITDLFTMASYKDDVSRDIKTCREYTHGDCKVEWNFEGLFLDGYDITERSN